MAQKHTIFINDVRHQVEEDALTGSAIKALGEIPPADALFLEVPGPEPDRKIEDAETVELRSGMKFYDLPPTTRG
ncbi:MAG: multiubiquitin domain-containing protein [Dehalococcoidia bacterium]